MRIRIDELAQRADTTSRNIRSYQAKGLLPPPELDGRTGYYGQEHLRRLELIDELQQRGFSLAAIRQTLDAWSQGGHLAHLLGLDNLLNAPFTDEEPRTYQLDELVDRFPEAAERPELVQRAVDMGLLREAENDTYRAPSPLLVEAGAELARAGVPLESIFELVEAIRPDIADIASHFVDLVARHLVMPIAETDETSDDVGDVVDAIRRLKPLALEVVRPFLAWELQSAIDSAIRDQASRLDAPSRHPER